jgi:dimethylaniline monooxygenase (N-oxide forming)
MPDPFRVCIVGGGPQGLAALKNLLELNDGDAKIFEVELLEARNCLGGKWSYTKDPSEATALPNTKQNTSRFKNCYTDFPVTEAWRAGAREGPIPVHLNQEETAFYLEQYAQHFGLLRHIRFGQRVKELQRNEGKAQWDVAVLHDQSGSSEHILYDKVIVASGQHHDPNMPKVEGMEYFNGKAIHSAEFKRSIFCIYFRMYDANPL